MTLRVRHAGPMSGTIGVPGDKSITHRALLLGGLGDGPSRIDGYLDSGDCRATIGCLEALGVTVERVGEDALVVHGSGIRGWQEPDSVLDCVRSGTTMRLITGLLAGQEFYSVLSGDPQLLRRPMDRIVSPLKSMSARIWGRGSGRYAPLSIDGGGLDGIEYAPPIASAQVKSCVLLAGLYAEGTTTVAEPGPSRDHTERMLRARGIPLRAEGLRHILDGPAPGLAALRVSVPGDFSSAAYFVVGALLVPGSEVLLRNVGTNPTRTGLLDVLEDMGARIEREDERDEGGEPVADLLVRVHGLHGVEVGGDTVPRMIDEFPILALAATQAEGTTVVRDAAELRVKETDRIDATVHALQALGAQIEGRPDGFVVEGPTPLVGSAVESLGDHRLGMTLAIAGLLSRGETTVGGSESIPDSYPGFVRAVNKLSEGAIA